MLKIITTADGSPSLLNELLNETYHSVHGALQESRHVFIDRGLAFVSQKKSSPIRIVEVGFGTGLNALLSLQFAEQHQRMINYLTIESSPLPEDIWSKLNYRVGQGSANEYDSLHRAAWDTESSINASFRLYKLRSTLQAAIIPWQNADIVYYDAFAPSKQPELWERNVLAKMFAILASGGLFVTYCAKGQLKRDLKSLGFSVETLDGPPGKKEMVRAVKP